MKPFPRIKGCKLFLTGGYVRDTLLNRTVKDRDFAVQTNIYWDTFVKRVEEIGKIYQAKKEFYSIRCNINGEDIDLTMLRKDERYLDGRHPSVVIPTKKLMADAQRRDLTINSMYMDNKGNIIDYFNGQRDIYNKVIRAVGNPGKRFREDYLRILRAIRFSIQLNFKIEPKTFYEMERNVKGLSIISHDRIMDELNKCFLIDSRRTMEELTKIENMTETLDGIGIYFKAINKKRR